MQADNCVQITFEDVSIKTRGGKSLLKNVSGVFLPGISAILGPSGAGKSLLLSVLAGHMSNLPARCQFGGSVRVNLTPLPEFRYMALLAAYVKQVRDRLSIIINKRLCTPGRMTF